MNRDALEQALALQKSPTLRFSVRDQPLAPNLLTVIQLAAASQPLLEDTAQRLDMTPENLLEAVRFYLQQALFEGEPEAYRTLAVAPDADTADIHERYRWLQRWLHPDRRGEDWESLFASRLNWAWSLLRNDAARAAYDEQRGQTSQATTLATPTSDAPEGVAMANGEWRMVPIAQAPSPRRHFKSVVVGTAFVLCCGLLYLAIVREDADMPGRVDTRASSLVAVVEPDPDSIDASTAAAALALDVQTSNTRTAGVDAAFEAGLASGKLLTQAPPPVHERNGAATADEGTPRMGGAGVDGSEVLPPRETIAGGVDRVPLASTVPATPTAPVRVPPGPGPAPISVTSAKTTASVAERAHRDSTRIAQATPAPNRAEPRAANVPKMASPTIVASNPPAPTAPPVASAAPHAPANRPATKTVPRLAPKAVGTTVATTEKPANPTLLGAVGTSGATRPVDHSLAVPATLSSTPQPPPSAPPASAPSAPRSSVDMVARIDVAREHVRQLVSYYRRTDAGEPHWPDAHAPYSAQQTRLALRERNGLPLAARFTLDTPQWRMSSEAVAVEAGYRVGRDRGIAERGLLRVDMVWGEDAWQFTRVELEPQQ